MDKSQCPSTLRLNYCSQLCFRCFQTGRESAESPFDCQCCSITVVCPYDNRQTAAVVRVSVETVRADAEAWRAGRAILTGANPLHGPAIKTSSQRWRFMTLGMSDSRKFPADIADAELTRSHAVWGQRPSTRLDEGQRRADRGHHPGAPVDRPFR